MDSAVTERSSASGTSGKLVIAGILAIALVAAGVSWWFRFHATHLAARFWGPHSSLLIGSSQNIKLSRINRNAVGLVTTSMTRNVSKAPGMTHLRTALLEDKNFKWPASDAAPPAAWRLEFVGDSPNEVAEVYFTPDLNYTFHPVSDHEVRGVSCTPIAAGLLEMFTEMMAGPAAAGPPAPGEPPTAVPATAAPTAEPTR